MGAIDRIETVLEQREQTPYALCKFLGINQSSYSTWKAPEHSAASKIH